MVWGRPLCDRFLSGGLCRASELWLRRALLVLLLGLGVGMVPDGARVGPSLRSGVAALTRQDYVAAARILAPLAQRGNAEAQAYMGYLYANGRGVPQNHTQAAIWYRRAAEQGYPTAQYELGLQYDKGQGVPQDPVEAEKWLILAAATPVTSRLESAAKFNPLFTHRVRITTAADLDDELRGWLATAYALAE